MKHFHICNSPGCSEVALRKFEKIVPPIFSCIPHQERIADSICQRWPGSVLALDCNPDGFEVSE